MVRISSNIPETSGLKGFEPKDDTLSLENRVDIVSKETWLLWIMNLFIPETWSGYSKYKTNSGNVYIRVNELAQQIKWQPDDVREDLFDAIEAWHRMEFTLLDRQKSRLANIANRTDKFLEYVDTLKWFKEQNLLLGKSVSYIEMDLRETEELMSGYPGIFKKDR